MAIVLTEYDWPVRLMKSGRADDVGIVAGQRLVIETSPGGKEVMDAVCPVGKAWNVTIIVEIEETDA